MAKSARVKKIKTVDTESTTGNFSSAETMILGSDQALPRVVDPLEIISKAALGADIDEEKLDRQYNDVVEENVSNKPGLVLDPEHVLPGVTTKTGAPIPKTFNKTSLEELDEIAAVATAEVKQIRKVVIKKINRFKFRLGLERITNDKMNLLPGTAHTWQCDKKGTDFITGLENRPEDRKRLERLLRVDLGPQSSYWANLTFRLEDKEHGMIMNFDDTALGPYYEVVYFGMLGSSIIAPSLQDYLSGKRPMAEWYIEDKEAEAEAKAASVTSDIEAMRAYDSMSFDRRRGIAKLLGPEVGNGAWGASDKVVGTELWDYIKKSSTNAAKFLDHARKNDAELNVRIMVSDAIKLNVIRKNKVREYQYGDVIFGPSEDNIIGRLILPQFSQVRQAIQAQITAKR